MNRRTFSVVVGDKDRLLLSGDLVGSPENARFGKVDGLAIYSEQSINGQDLLALTLSRYLIEVISLSTKQLFSIRSSTAESHLRILPNDGLVWTIIRTSRSKRYAMKTATCNHLIFA